MMQHDRIAPGFTLVELLMFVGLAAIMGTTLVSVYIATQEARVRQRGIAAVEQRGTQILEQITQHIRRAEAVISPTQGTTGKVLALQMGLNSEFPTIVGGTASGALILIQKTSTSSLLASDVTVSNLSVVNIDGKSARVTFTLTATIPSVPISTYTKQFSAAAALYTDDVSDAGGCVSCAAPSCVSNVYTWQHCQSGTCTSSSFPLQCP